MKTALDDVFSSSLPALDLHGEIRDSARVLINEFINDNYILRNDKIVIIHGVGTGALKEETTEILKRNKYVLEYHVNHFNVGCTLVYLRKRD